MLLALRRSLIGVIIFFLPLSALGQMTGNVDKLKADLHGDNIDRAVAAASALGSLKGDEAMDALMGALQLGAPSRLTLALIEAIDLHQNAKSITLLQHFTTNRRPEIRVAAIKAIGGVQHAQVVPILLDALGDSSPMVRAQAARILGERQEHRAERSLLKMLLPIKNSKTGEFVRLGDKAAAGPLGQIAGVETAKVLSEHIGEIPDEALATALGGMIKRPDFGPDPLRKEVVEALGKIPGPDATAALVEYIATVPPKEVRLSKVAAEKILEGRQK